ncbi:MAG: hypothetical protein JRH16_12750 [Deltaproteobacteria bacterium]|nr:hypothetical protein [Deltaproteobacteria bacterium]MBW2360989.1 hypothetical protein [Deltaproteobacteria bacterium]
MSEEEAVERISDGRVWDDFCERLKEAGHKVLDAAPDDPFDRAEGLRYVSRLARTFLRNATETHQPARMALGHAESPKIGLDNPDYVYCGASLDPGATYTLRGELGDAQMIGFGTFSGALGTEKGLVRDGHLESQALELDADGHFEITISQREHPVNWLRMGPETNSLNARQTLLRRAEQRQAPLELERLGKLQPAQPLDPARFSRALDRAGLVLGGTISQFLAWTASFQEHTHEIRPIAPQFLAAAQGDPNTSYNYSYWEIGADEAFVIDLDPPACDYWNLQIGNHWLESLDFMSLQTHVNQETAVADADGHVRIVVAGRDPGVPNWLDTAGHVRGALALRWVGAEKIPEAQTQVVPISSLG